MTVHFRQLRGQRIAAATSQGVLAINDVRLRLPIGGLFVSDIHALLGTDADALLPRLVGVRS